ncbi:MAG: hypothetical protein HYY18_09410 [Planctomycetes bacterium]|nr:hypothetical protein [Planctomycetota bacterium]
MKMLIVAGVAFAAAGCTATVEPGLREGYTTKVDWRGTACRVEARKEAATVSGTPGAVTYEFEGAKWAAFLAACLAEDLDRLGAAKAEAPVFLVALERVVLEDRAISQASRAEVYLKVTCGEFSRIYRGLHESQLNFPDASRRAAADALKAAVEDDELRRLAARP